MGEEVKSRLAAAPVVALGAVIFFALVRWRQSRVDADKGPRRSSQLSRLGLRKWDLTAAERKLVAHIMDPKKVEQVTDDDVIGQGEIIARLRKTIRISLRGAGRASVLSQGRGILLSGPPGTGKTTLAELAAQQNNCNLLRISPDVLRDKLYGETEKTVAAIFSLSQKLWGASRKATIVFMDEVDTILGDSSDTTAGEHEANRTARSIFAQKWDGIEAHPGLIIFGTTNHEARLPHYIYRRFTARFTVALPGMEDRRLIFRRFIHIAAQELAALRGGADAVPAATDIPALSRFAQRSLLEDDAAALRPLRYDAVLRLTATLRDVLHPSVPIQELLCRPFTPPLELLARLTEGYAGSDIRDVVHHGTPQDDDDGQVTYESLLEGLAKVVATENRSRAVRSRAASTARSRAAQAPANGVQKGRARPAAANAADTLLCNVALHLFPVMKLIALSVLLSFAAKVSGSIEAIRASMQDGGTCAHIADEDL
eukprot:jgi/Ulvmu1/9103/UM005_0198.1